MINQFEHFNEASRLYAKYSTVVDEMWELFKQDVASFHDALKAQIISRVMPREFIEERRDATRSWYLRDISPNARDDQPYAWIGTKTIETIDPGLLRLHIETEGTDPEFLRQINSLSGRLKLPSNCEFVREGKFVAVVIRYGEADPVSTCLEPVMAVLIALDEIGK